MYQRRSEEEGGICLGFWKVSVREVELWEVVEVVVAMVILMSQLGVVVGRWAWGWTSVG